VHDLNVSRENRSRVHHERTIGLAMHKPVVRVNILPDDNDGKNPRVGGHKTGVDGFASRRTLSLVRTF